MAKKILITGGTGLVGKVLTQSLLEKGYQVAYLSRSKKQIENVEVYEWDIPNQKIEEEAFKDLEGVIHLAGAGVADKSWTAARKKEILDSRTESTKLLHHYLSKVESKPKAFISASAIGIYGDSGEILMTEGSPQATDFLADVTKKWEKEIDPIADLGIRTVKLRIGVVLSPDGGALAKLVQPIRMGAGAALGSGKQYMSWIHIQDLANMFVWALENENSVGAYNAVAPSPVSNSEMTQQIAKVLKKPLILPNVPSFAMKLMLGEMASIVLAGSKVSSQKIEAAGFEFQFADLEKTLKDLLS